MGPNIDAIVVAVSLFTFAENNFICFNKVSNIQMSFTDFGGIIPTL